MEGNIKRESSMLQKFQSGIARTKHRFSSMTCNRKSTTAAANDLPSEPLRSTHSSSSTSTFSSDKNEIYGYFSDDKTIDSFKIAPNSIILSRIKSDGTSQLMVTQKMKTTPSFMCLVSDKLGKPHLVVYEEPSQILTIFKTVGKIITPIHEEKFEVGKNALSRIVAAFEPFNALLAIQVSRKFVIFISFAGEKPNVKIEKCEEFTPQSLGWMKDKDENLKLVTAKIGWDRGNKKILFEEFNIDLKDIKLPERVQVSKSLHAGHLIQIPAPFHGFIILGKHYITYYNHSVPVTRELSHQKELKYTCFSLLGTNKVLFVDHDNVLYMSRLVVEEELSTKILSIDTQIISKNIHIKNMYATDEFSIMMELEDDTWKFGYLTRERPGIKYILEIVDQMRAKDEDQIASPPLRARLGMPAVVQKPGRPDTGDVLNGHWCVMKMLGAGAYGTVHFVHDKKKKEVHVLKTQRVDPTEPSIANELNFLRKIKTFDNHSGFPYLVDEFVLYDKWQLMIISNEGRSLLHMLNMNDSQRFTDENLIRIGYQTTMTLLKMHECGYLHRDLHEGNLLVKLSNKTVVLTLIDFGFCMKENETKPQKFMATSYASVHVCEGKRSIKKDDLYSMHCVLLKSGGHSTLFDIADKDELKKMKKKFHEDPSKWFDESQHWMVKLYNLIKNIPLNDEEPAKTLLGYFDNGLVKENSHPDSKIEYTSTNGVDFTIN